MTGIFINNIIIKSSSIIIDSLRYAKMNKTVYRTYAMEN